MGHAKKGKSLQTTLYSEPDMVAAASVLLSVQFVVTLGNVETHLSCRFGSKLLACTIVLSSGGMFYESIRGASGINMMAARNNVE